MNMNTQNIELDALSDDELNAVVGGRLNMDNPVVETCLIEMCAVAGHAADYFVNRIQVCA
jgi:hypothetical protein